MTAPPALQAADPDASVRAEIDRLTRRITELEAELRLAAAKNRRLKGHIVPDLKVEIDGQLHPLTNCVWITWAPCGCPCGALTAAFGDEAFATEEQAWREHYPLKRDRDRYQKQGYRLELMGWDRYRADVDLAAKCPHVKAKTTQQTLDAAS